MIEFEPPQIACVISEGDYSFAALKATGECVIAVPAVKLAPKVVKIGNCHGGRVDKFQKFELTPVSARKVIAPLVKECFANLECKVIDSSMVSKYNLFILEVVKAWIDPAQKDPKTIHHQGYGKFVIDGRIMKLPSAMR
jgi:flavin reductase (DIM6/NTAB) family NADH-FMN oxidoreductase RutF